MINRLTLITVIAIAGFFAYGQGAQAFVAPECPCDTESTLSGLTGNEIIDMVCPGGEISEEASVIFNENEVSVSAGEPLISYIVSDNSFGREIFSCEIIEGDDGPTIRLRSMDYEFCRQRLIERCNLRPQRAIPTMSEWGMIATAGVLGLAGLYAVRRRRAVA